MSTKRSNHPSDGIDFAPLGFNESTSSSQPSGRSVDIVRFTLTHWPKMAVGFLAGIVLGVIFYIYSGPRYDASTRILVSKLASTPLQQGEATTYGDRAEHVEIIKSAVIVQRAYEKHNLGELPTVGVSDDAVRDLIEGLKVKRSAGQDRSFLNFFDISFQSRSKKDAAAVIAAVVDAYDEYLAETRKEQSTEVLTLIEQADVKLQKEIDDLKAKYREFRREAPILFQNPVGQVTSSGGQIATPPNHYMARVDDLHKVERDNIKRRNAIEAQIEVLTEMIKEGESRQAIEQYVMMSMSQQGGSEGGSGGTTTNPLLIVKPSKERLDEKLLLAKIREAELLHHLASDHPDVQKKRKEIQGILEAYYAEGLVPPQFGTFSDTQATTRLEREGVDLASIYLRFLNEQLKQLDYSDEAVRAQLKDAIAQAKEASDYEVIEKQLSDDLQAKQALRDGVAKQLQLTDITKEQTGYRMKQISDIVVELSIKRILKIVGAFGILGALCVFAYRYFTEWQDMSLKSLDEVRRYTNSSVMGAVPHFVVDPRARDLDSSGLSEALTYYHRPGSREAEAYRSVRTTLFFSTAPKNERVIQVSSPEPGDGKTTSIANLAVAVAQSGKRVLLIDGDLRRPTIHGLFNLPQHVGLSDVLRREVEWMNAVRPTEIDGLFVLTAGDTPDNPAELLSTSDLSSTLKAARGEFDYVFIDTPPILAVSDPCIISPHVDGMVLVVRMQKNKRPAVIRTKDILDSHGVQVYGIIANDMGTDESTGENYDAYAGYYNTGRSQQPIDTRTAKDAEPALTHEG
ncbi:MAG: polysaccharide biosynthesis tyrosine autokinase [Planctomycetaceae bacterium]|nr:polysaccharide biosynthesis tyrosine autokinase [Planctomycetaceae bacterium]